MVDLENPCRVWIQVVDFSPHLSCLGSHSFVSISLSIPWLAQTWGAWYHWTFIFPHIRPYRTEGRAGRQLYSGNPAAPSRETSPWKKLAPWCCMNMNPLLTKMWYLYYHIHIHFWTCLTFIFIFCNSVIISCIITRTRSTLDLIWFWPVSSIYIATTYQWLWYYVLQFQIQNLYAPLIGFLAHENILLDTKIIALCELVTKIWPFQYLLYTWWQPFWISGHKYWFDIKQ